MKMWIFFFLNKDKWFKYCLVYFQGTLFVVLHSQRYQGDLSVLTCYCCLLVWDLEANDGSLERPFYMNKTLARILNKRNLKKPIRK